MANYVSNKELLKELIISKQNDKLTDTAILLLQRMVKEFSRTLRYKSQMVREDCQGSAMLDVLLYWKNFNPEYPNANAFSYFTQIIKNGYAKGFNLLFPEIKQDIKMVPIDKDSGIYNI